MTMTNEQVLDFIKQTCRRDIIHEATKEVIDIFVKHKLKHIEIQLLLIILKQEHANTVEEGIKDETILNELGVTLEGDDRIK